MARLLSVVVVLLLTSRAEGTTLLDYRFTITQPLQHISEFIGEAANPIVFDFIVAGDAPNLNPPEGVYGFGFGDPGYGSVSIGGVTSVLDGGTIQINSTAAGYGFNAGANGHDTGVTFNGRSLFVSAMSLFDPTSQSIGVGLPSDLDSKFAIYFGLTFRPGPLDPNQNDYVKFDANVLPGNYSIEVLEVASVPEPGTWAMLILGFAAVAFMGWRKRPVGMAAWQC